jgi:hypothetical protein
MNRQAVAELCRTGLARVSPARDPDVIAREGQTRHLEPCSSQIYLPTYMQNS